ncbi:MAG TPA: CDP-alcohol phosphatidyltransferase family protein [Magnetospirillum sp.]|nr:CDP-alcohol phosphatidyltransferase family protein [Magnetospirillum sp.]
MIRHVPNALTILRLFSVPVTVWLVTLGLYGAAFWLFVGAGVTDAVDGAIARLANARSRLGTWLDPLADKALLVSVYVTLAWLDQVPVWLVVLVVLRDVVIVLYAVVYVLAGRFSGAPLFISKINTAAQLMLAALVLAHLGFGWGRPAVVDAFVVVVAATTVASAAGYLMVASRKVPAGDP